jgi:hypothetical protein
LTSSDSSSISIYSRMTLISSSFIALRKLGETDARSWIRTRRNAPLQLPGSLRYL